MASTLLHFSTELFNNLPHIDTLTLETNHTPSEQLKNVIKCHNLLDAVAITLTHKHFDLNPNEIVVGSYNADENKIVMDFRSISPESSEDVFQMLIPFQFVFSFSRGWMPVAFWDINSGGDIMSTRLQRVLLSDFLESYSTVLKSLQDKDHGDFAEYGVSLIFQSFVQGYESGLLETTDDIARNQWFRVQNTVKVPDSSESVTTIWHWNVNSDTLMEDECRSTCIVDRWSHDHNSTHF
jgi:hypothetical protein